MTKADRGNRGSKMQLDVTCIQTGVSSLLQEQGMRWAQRCMRNWRKGRNHREGGDVGKGETVKAQIWHEDLIPKGSSGGELLFTSFERQVS